MACRYVRKGGIKSKIVIFGMTIASVAFTAIIIITNSLVKTIKDDITYRYGNYTMKLAYAEEQLQQKFIDEYCDGELITKDLVGFSNVQNKNICIFACSPKWYENFNCTLKEGKFPSNSNEIIIPETLQTEGCDAGDTINISVYDRFDEEGNPLNELSAKSDRENTRGKNSSEYVIVGIFKVDEGVNIESEADWTLIYAGNEGQTSSHSYIYSTVVTDLDRTYEAFGEAISFNLEYLSAVGATSESTYDTVMTIRWIMIAFVAVAVVFFVGNSALISYKERYRETGNLLSNGATAKQIGLMMFCEILIMSLISIPTGIFIGWSIIRETIDKMSPLFSKMAYIETSFKFVFDIKGVLIITCVVFSVGVISSIIPILLTRNIEPIALITENQVYGIMPHGKTNYRTNILLKLSRAFRKSSRIKNLSSICSISVTMVILILALIICSSLVEEEDKAFRGSPYDISVRRDFKDISDFENWIENNIEQNQYINDFYYVISINDSAELNSPEDFEIIAIPDKMFDNIADEGADFLLCGNETEYVLQDNDYIARSKSLYNEKTFEDYSVGNEVKTAEKIISSELFKNLTCLNGMTGYYMILPLSYAGNFIMGAIEEAEIYLYTDNHRGVAEALAEESEESYIYDLADEHEQSRVTLSVIRFFVAAFTIIIFVISFLNLFFTTAAGILLRKRDYSLLVSLGASAKQIDKIIICEYARQLVDILIIGNLIITGALIILKIMIFKDNLAISPLMIVPVETAVIIVYMLATGYGCIKAKQEKEYVIRREY